MSQHADELVSLLKQFEREHAILAGQEVGCMRSLLDCYVNQRNHLNAKIHAVHVLMTKAMAEQPAQPEALASVDSTATS